MENYIIGAILIVIAAAVITYLVKQKKKGVKCAGCPYCKGCDGYCGAHEKEKN